MKRLITIIVTGVLALMFLLPNLSLAAGVKGGIKVGVSIAKLHGDDVAELQDLLGEDLKSRIGFSAGGFITFNINKFFAIQPEVLYTQKGLKIEGDFLGETVTILMKLDYLEIPVLVKIIFPSPGGVKPCVFAGPVLALKLSSKLKVEALGESEEVDIEDVRGTGFGLIIGAGVDFGLGASGMGKMTLDVRYSLGLSTVDEVVGGVTTDIKNGVFSLMVGFSF